MENLVKLFPTPKGMLHAVDGVSFAIDEGQTMGVVGESGCGKSTLGRTVINLLEKTSGDVFFEGRNITDLEKKDSKYLRRNMQMIFQDPFSSLNPRMTVSQSIAEPLRIYRACQNRRELDERVRSLMDTVGLAYRFKDTYPHELDGGRRQRIGVARALALDPKFIACDEPVSALDVSIQAQILNLLMDLQEKRGFTYLFITHDLSVVKHISNNICVMYLGNLVETADTDELFDNPLHPYTKALLAAIPKIDAYKNKFSFTLKGEIATPIEPKPGCRFSSRCDYANECCKTVNPPLKEFNPGHFAACHRIGEV